MQAEGFRLWIDRNGFPVFVLISALAGIVFQEPWCFLAPLFLLFFQISVHRLHWIFYLLLISIPLSTEVDLPGGFATDFPDELLMWWLFGFGLVYVLHPATADIRKILKHPITVALAVHWLWILFTSLSSQDVWVSLKYWISKTWYLFVFYILAYLFLKNEKRLFRFALLSIGTAALTVMIIEWKHAGSGFAFDQINTAVRPFYRNHVNYACLLVCLLPYAWPVWHLLKRKAFFRMVWIGLVLVLLAGIFFSYTRAAYLALPAVILVYPVVRWKWVNRAMLILPALGIAAMIYFTSGNRYLELAPDYNKAVTHVEFGTLLEATPQGKDISTMERLYRWVAGVRMVGEKYLVGFGPAGFYSAYPAYTLHRFSTYVSENPDRSGIHNYYLMTAVEQGLPGLIFFLVLIWLFFLEAQPLLRAKLPALRHWGFAATMSMSSILVILFFNDMVETDKVGTYFFLNFAILLRLNQIRILHESN